MDAKKVTCCDGKWLSNVKVLRDAAAVWCQPDVVEQRLEWALSEGVAFWGMYQEVSADHISWI